MITKRSPNAYDIYQLGIWLAQLDSSAAYGSWGMTRVCLETLTLCRQIEGLEFIGYAAWRYKEKMTKEYSNDTISLKDVDRHLLQSSIKQWWGRLDEVSKRWILTLPQTHLDIDKLNRGGKSFLEEEEWNMLQPLEQQGLNEATICLLSNAFTSAEFIALRTVESVLRRWYKKKTGKTIRNVKWGNILDKLDKEFPEPDRPAEISSLYHLKRRRNDIAHPDVISSEENATVTFINVINVCKAVKSFFTSLMRP